MQVTAVEGIVKNGKIELSGNIELPEMTRVYVVVPNFEGRKSARIMSPRLVNKSDADKLVKKVEIDVDDEV